MGGSCDRPAAVAGSWYPASPARLADAVDRYVSTASTATRRPPRAHDTLIALIAPHAGLVYSGPVAAHAYRLLNDHRFDVIVLVGPSHYVAFSGVSVWPRGSFETPLGALRVDEALAADLATCCSIVHERPAAHAREHSLEMQLPFVAHLAAGTPILPLVMGRQTRDTAAALAAALGERLRDRRPLLVASSDLSHFNAAHRAAQLDAQVEDSVRRFDPDGLMSLLERRPDHACGGGPMVSVMSAARLLGAHESEVLCYADSGDVSGDKSSVVGYLAAALWKPVKQASKTAS
jgi:AmmeMemoRadiSam system protein B